MIIIRQKEFNKKATKLLNNIKALKLVESPEMAKVDAELIAEYSRRAGPSAVEYPGVEKLRMARAMKKNKIAKCNNTTSGKLRRSVTNSPSTAVNDPKFDKR